ncbi:hypothetical protein PYCC9005_006038 [Savitreella phatthalungensis]
MTTELDAALETALQSLESRNLSIPAASGLLEHIRCASSLSQDTCISTVQLKSVSDVVSRLVQIVCTRVPDSPACVYADELERLLEACFRPSIVAGILVNAHLITIVKATLALNVDMPGTGTRLLMRLPKSSALSTLSALSRPSEPIEVRKASASAMTAILLSSEGLYGTIEYILQRDTQGLVNEAQYHHLLRLVSSVPVNMSRTDYFENIATQLMRIRQSGDMSQKHVAKAVTLIFTRLVQEPAILRVLWQPLRDAQDEAALAVALLEIAELAKDVQLVIAGLCPAERLREVLNAALKSMQSGRTATRDAAGRLIVRVVSNGGPSTKDLAREILHMSQQRESDITMLVKWISRILRNDRKSAFTFFAACVESLSRADQKRIELIRALYRDDIKQIIPPTPGVLDQVSQWLGSPKQVYVIFGFEVFGDLMTRADWITSNTLKYLIKIAGQLRAQQPSREFLELHNITLSRLEVLISRCELSEQWSTTGEATASGDLEIALRDIESEEAPARAHGVRLLADICAAKPHILDVEAVHRLTMLVISDSDPFAHRHAVRAGISLLQTYGIAYRNLLQREIQRRDNHTDPVASSLQEIENSSV